jgi:hypothetical protein
MSAGDLHIEVQDGDIVVTLSGRYAKLGIYVSALESSVCIRRCV